MKKAKEKKDTPALDPATIKAMQDEFATAMMSSRDNLNHFYEMGISVSTIHRFGIGWDAKVERFTIPMYGMRDEKMEITGWAGRKLDGSQLTVAGSKAGLITASSEFERWKCRHWVFSEGFTDTAMLHQMGYQAFGRPGTGVAIDVAAAVARKWLPTKILIFADNDEPGDRGAKKLAKALSEISSIEYLGIIRPPEAFKDVRDWTSKERNVKFFQNQMEESITGFGDYPHSLWMDAIQFISNARGLERLDRDRVNA